MNPILKYPGAKWRLAPWTLQYMPPHESYIEPYFGSGALFFSKRPARIETINDIDGSVVNFFKVCRESPDELAQAISLTPWAREEFELAAANCDNTPDSVEQARRFAVKCWMAFGASASSTGWRNTTGNKKDGGPDNPKLWRRLPEIIHQAANRLMDAQIENRPALDIIRRFDGQDTLLYADPPYAQETRTAHRKQYRHEMYDKDHEELLYALQNYSGMVMLSGYDCALYRETFPDWRMITTKARAERGAVRTECLWLNPAACERLERPLRFQGA